MRRNVVAWPKLSDREVAVFIDLGLEERPLEQFVEDRNRDVSFGHDGFIPDSPDSFVSG